LIDGGVWVARRVDGGLEPLPLRLELELDGPAFALTWAMVCELEAMELDTGVEMASVSADWTDDERGEGGMEMGEDIWDEDLKGLWGVCYC
jgi:hypothetical protein